MSRRYDNDYGRVGGGGRDNREPPRDNRGPPGREHRDREFAPPNRGEPRIADPYVSAGRRPMPSMPIDDRDMEVDEPPRISARTTQPMRPGGGMDIDDVGPRYRQDDRGPPRREAQQVMVDPQGRRLAYDQDPRRPTVDYDDMVDVRTGGRPVLNDYFLPGDGINREVIQIEICRYLGQDARVRPYMHPDGRSGYMITAYRALTSHMIASLKQDSQKFEQERSRRDPRSNQVTYPSSNTYKDSRFQDYEEDDSYPREASYREPREPREPGYRETRESGYREPYREPREREYREPVRDMREARDPAFSPGYGGDFGRPQAGGRHQLPVSSPYVSEPAYSSATASYALAATTQPPYQGGPEAQPRIFSTTTPDPVTGRTTQAGYPNVYPSNTQASQQAPPGYYQDPRTGQYIQNPSRFSEEGGGRHRTNR